MVRIRISAIVCTLNRSAYLSEAIKSLVEQTLEKELYEILIVDNGSTDNTRRMVSDEFFDVQNLRYIYEPILGLSRARNTGWLNARGEYIAYLDDDAVASEQWLGKILEVFDTIKPMPGCVGGRIEPVWEAPRPAWLSDKLFGSLTILYWGDKPIFINDRQWLAGANMAFQKHLLESTGGFNVNLGRKGNKLLSMEENLLRHQLEDNGYRYFYHPNIAVSHYVPVYRLSKNWVIQRSYWNGVSDAVVKIYRIHPTVWLRLWKGAKTIFRIFFSLRYILALLLPTNDPNRFAVKCSLWAQIGHVAGLWSMRR